MKLIEGNYGITPGHMKSSIEGDDRKYECFYLAKNGRRIASVHYAPDIDQVVMQIKDDVALTTKSMMLVLNMMLNFKDWRSTMKEDMTYIVSPGFNAEMDRKMGVYEHKLAKEQDDVQAAEVTDTAGGTPVVVEEGDTCPKCEEGLMGYRPVEGCSCHINPPCSRCVDNPLVCLKCGWNPEEEK